MIEILKRRIDELNQQLDKDLHYRQEIDQRISEREQHLKLLVELLAKEGGPDIDADSVRGGHSPSFLDAAYKVLAGESAGLHYKALTQRLADEGIYIPGKDPAANLLSRLCNDERFVRVGRGLYSVARGVGASYPARRKTRKKRPKKEGKRGWGD